MNCYPPPSSRLWQFPLFSFSNNLTIYFHGTDKILINHNQSSQRMIFLLWANTIFIDKGIESRPSVTSGAKKACLNFWMENLDTRRCGDNDDDVYKAFLSNFNGNDTQQRRFSSANDKENRIVWYFLYSRSLRDKIRGRNLSFPCDT